MDTTSSSSRSRRSAGSSRSPAARRRSITRSRARPSASSTLTSRSRTPHPCRSPRGAEALAIINSSPYPVIALGDYNSATDGSTTPTYANLIAGGLTDAWNNVQPSHPGRTCCQDGRLDTLAQPTERIDLVLTNGPWHADLAVRTGALPFRLAPPPMWASHHFGVFADLELK